MPARTMTARPSPACRRPHARSLVPARAPVRAMAAEGVGWAAYGLFYLTALTAFLGLPIGFAFYLLGLQN